MRFEFEGFNELERKLNNLKANARKLNGKHEIPLKDLFNTTFMLKNTNHNSIQSFFDHSPFEINSEEDFDEVPEQELDNFVSSNTIFNSWHEMLTEASKEWTINQIGLN